MLSLPDSSFPTGVETLAIGADKVWPIAASFNGELAVKLRQSALCRNLTHCAYLGEAGS